MRMDFAYASDKNYLPIVSVSMLSLLKQHNGKDIFIHFLGDGIEAEDKKKLMYICKKFNVSIIFYDIKKNLEHIEKEGFESFGVNCNYTAYARTLLPDILNTKAKKVLYLDCDTLIMRPLDELFQINLEQNIVAGVKDIVPSLYRRQIGMKNTEEYINSGILLINIEKWIDYNCTEKMKNFISDRNFFLYPDQDYINLVTESKHMLLPPEYNVLSPITEWEINEIRKMFMLDSNDWYTDKEIKSSLKEIKIVHLVNSFLGRPWQENSNSPFKDYWYELLEVSPFKEEFCTEKNRSSIMHKVLLGLYNAGLKKVVAIIYRYRMRNRLKAKIMKGC